MNIKKTICQLVDETLQLTDSGQIRYNLFAIKGRAEHMEDRLLKYCNAIEDLGFARIGRNYENNNTDEKQTPKKVIYDYGLNETRCPKCNTIFGYADLMDIKEVKEAIASRKLITYDGTNYTVTAYILRLIDRKWQHTLELKDLKTNSVRIVPMGKVEVKE